MRTSLLALSFVAVGRIAAADPAPPAPPAATTPSIEKPPHLGQLSVSLRTGLGLRALVPYHGEFCGQTDPNGDGGLAGACTGRAPFSFDLEAAYGVTRTIEPFLELRIGLEADFGRTPTDQDGARVFHVSPGARFFFAEAGRSKLFTTAQLVIDATGYEDAAGDGLGADVGLRNLSGLWWDVDRAYGVYAFVGETASFVRWMRFELEAGVGVQARYR